MPQVMGAATRQYAERAVEAHRLGARLRRAITKISGLTNSGQIMVVVAVVFWGLGRYAGGRPLYMLAYGVVVVVVASKFLTRRVPPVVGVRGDTNPRVREGTVVDLAVTMTSERRVANLVLEERLPLEFGQVATIAVASVSPEQPVEHTYAVNAWRRGVYELGPLTVRWGDPFGLTTREATLAESFELVVHPTVEPVTDRPLTRMWEDPPFRPPVSKPWPSGMELYGMRAYEPGDDVRRVVWRAFLRTGQLLVQEAEQGISDKVILLLDADRKMHSKGLLSESFEAGVRTIASLAVHHLGEGYEVTVEGNDAKIVGPVRTGPNKIRLLDELARLDLGDAPLSAGMARLASLAQRDTHLVIVTPYLDRESAARLELLTNRGVQVVVVALVWDEDHTENLSRATSLGAQVVEIRPNTPLAVAFRREVQAAARF
jgi:uncharacterized protein (DUF58 family)